jgi:hypothetical protein
MQPKLDGSHDKLPPDDHERPQPRLEELMEEVFEPLMQQMIDDEGIEALDKFVLESAEQMEDYLRVHAPEHELLVLLDEHRRKTQGFT